MARKVILGILAGFIILAALILVTKNLVIALAAKGAIRSMTGLSLSVGRLDIGVLRPAIEIRELKLRNPDGFSEPTMLDLKQLSVTYDLPALFKGKVHLPSLTIDLKEFNVVKNKQGVVNIDSLRALQQQAPAQQPAAGQKAPSAKQDSYVIQIDRMDLSIGMVRYMDYTAKASPSIKEFPVNLKASYENITNPQMLISTVVAQALMHTGIAGLSGIKLDNIKEQAVRTLQETGKGLRLDRLLPLGR